MKHLILFFLALFFVSSQSKGQEFWDNFEYSAGDTLSSYWLSLAPFGVRYMMISETGLTFPFYAGSGIGRAVRIDTVGPDAAAQFFDYFGITTGQIYCSFMLNVFSADAAGTYFSGIKPFLVSANPHGKVFVKDSSGFFAFGISKLNEAPVYTPAKYSRNFTYLLVLKYQFNPEVNDDVVSLFVFDSPPPGIEPSPSLGPVGTGVTDIAQACAFGVFQGHGGRMFGALFDGIYVDLTWNDFVLPVEMTGFNSTVIRNNVTLNWTTSSELNNSLFTIERRNIHEQNWIIAGEKKGSGTTNEPRSYIFKDMNVNQGIYIYRLKQTDYNSNFTYFELENDVVISLPKNFVLEQNYPNPFNPVTNISFEIPKDCNLKIVVYDMSGRELKTLVNSLMNAGYYTMEFNASGLSSGVYFYKLTARIPESGEEFISVKKMMVLK